MSTKRLMPGRVIQAYKRKGVKACRRAFVKIPIQGFTRCCGASVSLLSRKEINNYKLMSDSVWHKGRILGFSDAYLDGFMVGFDGGISQDWAYRDSIGSDKEYAQGYADGKASAALARKHKLFS